jgi:hypothetical protein
LEASKLFWAQDGKTAAREGEKLRLLAKRYIVMPRGRRWRKMDARGFRAPSTQLAQTTGWAKSVTVCL